MYHGGACAHLNALPRVHAHKHIKGYKKNLIIDS